MTDLNPEVSEGLDSGTNRTRRIIDSAQALGVDPASSIGTKVTGTIDGKFDNGYLVTVMVGTRKMRGVLYHIFPAGNVPQNATVPALVNNIGSELKTADVAPRIDQRRRRSDMSRKDPDAPRQNRTSYNFFFAEHWEKMKTLKADKDKALGKKIGALWNKLSKEEKSPYQELAFKDKERYRKEMEEYRERLKM